MNVFGADIHGGLSDLPVREYVPNASRTSGRSRRNRGLTWSVVADNPQLDTKATLLEGANSAPLQPGNDRRGAAFLLWG